MLAHPQAALPVGAERGVLHPLVGPLHDLKPLLLQAVDPAGIRAARLQTLPPGADHTMLQGGQPFLAVVVFQQIVDRAHWLAAQRLQALVAAPLGQPAHPPHGHHCQPAVGHHPQLEDVVREQALGGGVHPEAAAVPGGQPPTEGAKPQ